MATVIYEIPNSVKEMFEQGENSYRIIDYSIQEMDNIQSMQHFLDCIGSTTDNIEIDDGTQVVITHPDFDYKLVIDSGGLGDFYSHGYDVTLYSETVSSCGSEMLERLINSHFSLFRRLNQINNKEPQSEATQKALEEAREVNRFFSDKDSPRIVQS